MVIPVDRPSQHLSCCLPCLHLSGSLVSPAPPPARDVHVTCLTPDVDWRMHDMHRSACSWCGETFKRPASLSSSVTPSWTPSLDARAPHARAPQCI